MRRITLLTDFGTADGYVASMKGVMATTLPGVHLDDVAHDLDQGDVEGAARALGRYWSLWPRGTVHLVVVDPGVGTERRGMAVRADDRFLVGPDNGIFSRVLETCGSWTAVELATGEGLPLGPPASRTFHGRDLFAPAAAFLARGGHISRLGPSMGDPVLLPGTEPSLGPEVSEGRVMSADRFGNLITNLPGELLDGVEEVEVEGTSVPVGRTYADVEPGQPLALPNSDGLLEVAARDDSAARVLGAGPGAVVRVVAGGGVSPPRASGGLPPKAGPAPGSAAPA
ncbi:MAG: hypothetical protein EA352_02785 [Gemmatimonadales bacterium]|nr:MAG: hypothetical protein EA352_02785 [Gemmatimonadales bacterium]